MKVEWSSGYIQDQHDADVDEVCSAREQGWRERTGTRKKEDGKAYSVWYGGAWKVTREELQAYCSVRSGVDMLEEMVIGDDQELHPNSLSPHDHHNRSSKHPYTRAVIYPSSRPPREKESLLRL